MEHPDIQRIHGEYRAELAEILRLSTGVTTDIGGVEDTKPATREIGLVEAEITRRRAALVTFHTDMLAAIDAS